jgi:hypothetical protein
MTVFIYEFIHKCDSAGVTPAETQIDWFLKMVNKPQYRDSFIKFCFYHWENRHNEIFMTNILRHV